MVSKKIKKNLIKYISQHKESNSHKFSNPNNKGLMTLMNHVKKLRMENYITVNVLMHKEELTMAKLIVT